MLAWCVVGPRLHELVLVENGFLFFKTAEAGNHVRAVEPSTLDWTVRGTRSARESIGSGMARRGRDLQDQAHTDAKPATRFFLLFLVTGVEFFD